MARFKHDLNAGKAWSFLPFAGKQIDKTRKVELLQDAGRAQAGSSNNSLRPLFFPF